MYKLVRPELISRILDQFDESDEQTPRVWSVNNQSFEKNPGDLLLYSFRVRFGEQVEKCTAEVMRVTIGIPQLIRYSVQE